MPDVSEDSMAGRELQCALKVGNVEDERQRRGRWQLGSADDTVRSEEVYILLRSRALSLCQCPDRTFYRHRERVDVSIHRPCSARGRRLGLHPTQLLSRASSSRAAGGINRMITCSKKNATPASVSHSRQDASTATNNARSSILSISAEGTYMEMGSEVPLCIQTNVLPLHRPQETACRFTLRCLLRTTNVCRLSGKRTRYAAQSEAPLPTRCFVFGIWQVQERYASAMENSFSQAMHSCSTGPETVAGPRPVRLADETELHGDAALSKRPRLPTMTIEMERPANMVISDLV
ncbi:hypothetical protein BC835DRAFT_676702 [Cytidiella melzeri]|nr:hypothetical protein BC835DRAFT_676702 [Cytidiella melzeri]